jgi:hypothetical protein
LKDSRSLKKEIKAASDIVTERPSKNVSDIDFLPEKPAK